MNVEFTIDLPWISSELLAVVISRFITRFPEIWRVLSRLYRSSDAHDDRSAPPIACIHARHDVWHATYFEHSRINSWVYAIAEPSGKWSAILSESNVKPCEPIPFEFFQIGFPCYSNVLFIVIIISFIIRISLKILTDECFLLGKLSRKLCLYCKARVWEEKDGNSFSKLSLMSEIWRRYNQV